jgi:hypothetical protein
LSRPYFSLNAATASGSPAACSPRFVATASLGTSCVSRKTTRVIPIASSTNATARRRTKPRKLEDGRSLRRDLGASARAVGDVVKG